MRRGDVIWDRNEWNKAWQIAVGRIDGAPAAVSERTAFRHAIDMLGMLAEKTRGNLSMDEQRLIENSLTELRFRFVQAKESAPKASSEEKPQGSE